MDKKIENYKTIEFKVSADKVFYSMQGEGATVGQAAVFLRLALCNLKCKWCDTKYAWNKSIYNYKESESWSLEKTIFEVNRYKNVKHLVITGGEPLLQQEAIENLIKVLPDWQVEIETNGTIEPSKYLMGRCQFNISPKLKNSGNSDNQRLKPEILKFFNKLNRSYFKFVVKAKKDFIEIDELVKELKLENNKIIIMPEGKTRAAMITKSISLVEPVKERGWRLIPRLHIILWGNKRKK